MTLEEYYESIEDQKHKEIIKDLIIELKDAFDGLDLVVKWKQPMLVKDGAFILGFSVSKKHFSVSPDKYALDQFRKELEESGYSVKKMLFSIDFSQEINKDLLKKIIAFNIEDRKGSETFWRVR